MDYNKRIKDRANFLIDLSYKLIDSEPKSDHIAIYELKKLGERISNICESESIFQPAPAQGALIDRSLFQYQQ